MKKLMFLVFSVSVLFNSITGYSAQIQKQSKESVLLKTIAKNASVGAVLGARRDLTVLYLKEDKQQDAQKSLGQILSQFSSEKSFPFTINKIAEQAHKQGKDAQAKQLFSDALDKTSDFDSILRLSAGIAISDVYLGNDSAVESFIGKTISQYSAKDPQKTSSAISHIADTYLKQKNYKKARNIYTFLTNQFPYKHAEVVEKGIAVASINLGEFDAAENALTQLITNYPGNKYVPMCINHIADAYKNKKQYERARDLYIYIAEKCKGIKVNRAVNAQKGIALTSISLKDYDTADNAVNKLLTDFAGQNLSGPVSAVATAYKKSWEYEKARTMYKYIVNNYKKTNPAKYGLAAQKGVIDCSVKLKDKAAVSAGISRLLTEFASHKRIAAVVHGAGYTVEPFDALQAKRLYQYNITNHPEEYFGLLSRAYLARMNISKLNNERSAQNALNLFFTKYKNLKFAPRLAFIVGEGYWSKYCQEARASKDGPRHLSDKAKQYNKNTIAVWEKVISEFPDSKYVPIGYYFTAHAYEQLNDYPAAMKYYTKVVNDYPDYKRAKSAYMRIAKLYRRMLVSGNLGGLSKEEARAGMAEAYKRLERNHPGFTAARLKRLKKLEDSSKSRVPGISRKTM